MTRLQVVPLPGDRYGLVLDEAPEAWRILSDREGVARSLGAEFFVAFGERVDVVGADR